MGAQTFTTVADMKYSVVTQINAIDRDNDGLVDNLYFGDLGGQAFRVDLNNAASTTNNKISARAVRLLNQNNSNGSSPRFYETPTFSVHLDNADKRFAVVAFSSGNRSSPLSGDNGLNQLGSSVSANDGIFVIFDKDVGHKDLYSINSTNLTSKDLSLEKLLDNLSTGIDYSDSGWIYYYGTTTSNTAAGAGVYKGLESIYSVDNILYTNVYHRDGTGVQSSSVCEGGVQGDSYVYRFCLPTGKCDSARFTSSINISGEPDRIKLGAGILGTNLGSGQNPAIQNVITNTTDCSLVANKNKIECQSFSNKGAIQTLRWYESQ